MAFVGNGLGAAKSLLPRARARALHATCPSMVAKGDRVPADAGLMVLTDGAPTPVTAASIFDKKKVALVTVPGAMTGTCVNAHIPAWVAAADAMRAKGVDEVVCIAVNDAFVMDVFDRAVESRGKVMFIADGGADFTKKIGIEVDTGAFGGLRAKRGSFVVEDGVFTQVNLEDGTSYDGPSKPETVLAQL